ncbi:hypothetical protein PMAL9190_03894 [Photobacterium malacitanum]|uniref:Uncharacterized protein n=1 Tax=Photobacterium malacitanum TaxID=2204294 RepID=A0A1Y6MRC5_9GAMM|nr:hypothetical protein [Photobacterium malacitanum]SMY39093.1 hypothetical protein PMAL9190_03894 [Photobacterium malacitanum]
MEITINNICAIVTVFLAGFSLWQSIKVHNKQKGLARELGSLQKELTALDLKNAKEREMNKEKAEFTARFVTYGNGKQLVITNTGSSQARNVRIDFGEGANFVIQSNIEEYFPCNLDSSESVKLHATTSLGHREVREQFVLSWMDNIGGGRKEFSVQY